MTARRARFLQEDTKRLVRTAKAEGVRDYRVEVTPDGTISLIVGSAARVANRPNSCDDLLD